MLKKFIKANFIKYFLSLWKFLGRKKQIQAILLISLMILSGLSEVLNIAIIVPFLNYLTNKNSFYENDLISSLITKFGLNNNEYLVVWLSILFIGTILFSGFIRILNLYFVGRFSASIGNILSTKAFRNCLYQDYIFHKNVNSSKLISTLTTRTSISVTVCNSYLQFFTSLISICFLFIALLIIDFQMSFTTIIGIVFIYSLIVSNSNKKLRQNSRIVSSLTSQQFKELDEGFASFKEIILENIQDYKINIYNNLDEKMRLKVAQSLFIRSFPRYAIEALVISFIILLALYLDFKRSQDGSFITNLGILAVTCQRSLPYGQIMFQSWAYIRANGVDLEKVLDLATKKNKIPSEKCLKKFLWKEKIKFNNLSFAYEDYEEPILKKVNLEIKKGEKIGLIGCTGSGKSTFIDILMGLMKPSQGSLFVDDINIYEESNLAKLYSWRLLISHVPQNIFLSDASITENIAYGIPKDEIDMNLVKYCAKNACIDKFISALPNKFNTEVGEKGIRISGGQKQRIGIARALYKKSEILILDEATSALDKETEDMVIMSINENYKDKTVISISHRIDNLKDFDRTFNFQQGQIIV